MKSLQADFAAGALKSDNKPCFGVKGNTFLTCYSKPADAVSSVFLGPWGTDEIRRNWYYVSLHSVSRWILRCGWQFRSLDSGLKTMPVPAKCSAGDDDIMTLLFKVFFHSKSPVALTPSNDTPLISRVLSFQPSFGPECVSFSGPAQVWRITFSPTSNGSGTSSTTLSYRTPSWGWC